MIGTIEIPPAMLKGEAITKKANMNTVTSLDNKVGYTINYNTTLNNVREGDVVRVTITDTLPQSIDVNNSVLNNGIYNEENNTITWTKIYNIDKYMSAYPINVTIEYMVKYNDYISVNGDKLTNIASGVTIVNNTTTDGTEDSEDVNVEIKGTVEVLFKDDLLLVNNKGDKIFSCPPLILFKTVNYSASASGSKLMPAGVRDKNLTGL